MRSLAPDDADRAWLATLCVLCVEDDDDAREVLAEYIHLRAGRVVTARTGVEGLAVFKEERPAIVLTDIQMPGLDGLGMAEAIRDLSATVPIVVTTAHEQVRYLARAIDAGVDKFLTKPVDPDALDAALLACARKLRAEDLIAKEREREALAARVRHRESLGLLAGGMAHDFNNLLQTILSSVDLALGSTEPGTETHELLHIAMPALVQAVDLGRKLVTLSDAWTMDARRGPLGPTLQSAIAAGLSGSGVHVDLSVPLDLPDVRHDADLLARAFEQIVQNAREAMDGTGTLHVAAETRSLGAGETPPLIAGDYVAVTFRDGGHGIAPDHLPRIFDPYFTTKRRGSLRGTGLGLALCAAIVRKHGGAVTAVSPGEGAELTVLLPATESAAPA